MLNKESALWIISEEFREIFVATYRKRCTDG